MQVAPEAIGTRDLNIRKTLARLKDLNPRAPVKGDAEQAQAIVDDGAGLQANRQRRQDTKPQKFRRDQLQVSGVGEKCEDLVKIFRDDLFSFEAVDVYAHSEKISRLPNHART